MAAAGGMVADPTLQSRVDALEARIRSKMETETGFGTAADQASHLNKVFRFFNTDKDGFLSFEEFSAAMVRLNFVGVQKELRTLFDRYDSDGSGFLAYEEFSAGLLGLIPNPKGDPVVRSAIDRIRHKMAERGSLNCIRKMGRAFRIMDDSRDGRLDEEELKTGLRDFGVDLPDKDIHVVIKTFDRSGDGRVNYDELLRGLRGNLSARRRAMIYLAFDVLDRDGSGQVTIEDILSVYDASHHPDVMDGKCTEKEALGEFLDQFDTLEKDGIVTREEFLDYYRDVSASIDSDDYFELMIRNAWNISGGEGAMENTSNLRVLVVHGDDSQDVVEVKDSFGLDRSDVSAIRKKLEEQGVADIKEIKLTA